MADRVSGHGFKYDVHVGYGDAERAETQCIKIDFDARTDWRASATTERANPVVDYAEVDARLKAVITAQHWRLIEAIAERTAEVICTEFTVEQYREGHEELVDMG